MKKARRSRSRGRATSTRKPTLICKRFSDLDSILSRFVLFVTHDGEQSYKLGEMGDAYNEVALAELRMLEAHLKQRARICYLMIAGGVICLVAGIVMLVVGITGDQTVWVQSGNLKITACGFGGITMFASVAWALAAYQSRPKMEYTGPTIRARSSVATSP